MFEVGNCLWLIPALPLAAAALTSLIALFGPAPLRRHSHWPCILATVSACVVSLFILREVTNLTVIEPGDVPQEGKHYQLQTAYTWARIGAVDVTFTLRADGLSAIMLLAITFVGSLIAIYSAGYMHGEEGYPRYFAAFALFIFAMTTLVLASNFLVLYLGWEGVGLCSYLLIGFWFTKPSAAAAARKAFLVTRLGDVGLLLGIIFLWWKTDALDYDTVFAALQGADPGFLTVVCLLLFCGAIGKSAQFPLHVWLPDAMEGPTPVSALIHAATMVTAGVYLVARCTELFVQVPAAQLVVAVIGGFSALLAAAIALTQNDLKRVLAYSTISQLGYMFLGVGSGAVAGGIFHLFTHAFFKALLFLAAGSVMHAMGGVIDIRRFRGLRRVLPITHGTFLCGAAALAGVPLLSGFFSKDEILGGTLQAGSGPYGAVYLVLFLTALATAGMTAFYTTRAYLLTFHGETKVPEEAGHHAHESPPVMTVPLVILAVGAVSIGWVQLYHHAFSGFLHGHTRGISELVEPSMNLLVMGLSGLVAVAGIAAAWWVYMVREGQADRLASRVPALYQWSYNKFHFDELYAALVIRPLEALAEFCRVLDAYVVDALVDLVGQVPRLVGGLFRPVQNGLVQFYALAMVLGLTVFLLALLSKL